jgi:hypothetical protein
MTLGNNLPDWGIKRRQKQVLDLRPELVCVQISSKSGIEYYSLPDSFTGNIHIEFNRGGLSKVKKGEDLK